VNEDLYGTHVYDTVTAVVVVVDHMKTDDPEVVERYTKALERLEKLCHSIAANNAGSCDKLPAAVGLGDAFEVNVPSSKVEAVREIVDRSVEEAHLDVVAGIGTDVHEAKVAAEAALDSDNDDILVYHPDMDDVSKYDDLLDDLEKNEDDSLKEAKKVLKDIKQNAEVYASLREKNPKAYEAVVDTLRALIRAVAARKEEEQNDEKDAKLAQRTIDTHGNRNDREHARQAKRAMKDAAAKVPDQPQQEDQPPEALEQSSPDVVSAGKLDPDVIKAAIKQDAEESLNDDSGSLMYDKSIEDGDYEYSDDPELSKSLMYILKYGGLYD
jgi:GTP cyclohydrolase III